MAGRPQAPAAWRMGRWYGRHRPELRRRTATLRRGGRAVAAVAWLVLHVWVGTVVAMTGRVWWAGEGAWGLVAGVTGGAVLGSVQAHRTRQRAVDAPGGRGYPGWWALVWVAAIAAGLAVDAR